MLMKSQEMTLIVQEQEQSGISPPPPPLFYSWQGSLPVSALSYVEYIQLAHMHISISTFISSIRLFVW